MAVCDIDFTSLPILTGCPGDAELILVGNAAGGLDANGGYTVGYARRYWGDIKRCAAKAIAFVCQNYTVGAVGSPIAAGVTTVLIAVPNILQDSVFITQGGTELPRGDNTQISYTVDYYNINPNAVTITFDQATIAGQWGVLHYAYVP